MTALKHTTAGPAQAGTLTFGREGQAATFTLDEAGNLTITGTLTGPALPTTLQGLVPPYALAIEDPNTMAINRATYNAAGTDMWQFQKAGGRGFYINEGAQGRARDPVGNQVAFRTQCNVVDNGTGQHVFEVALSDNTVEFYVTALGDAATTRDMIVSRNLSVTGTATVAGIVNSGAVINAGTQKVTNVVDPTAAQDAATKNYVDTAAFSSFAAVTPATNVSAGTPALSVRTQPGSEARLQGQLVVGAAGVTSGVNLGTIPAGSRPAATTIVGTRFTGTGAAAVLFTINTDGTITCSANLVSGNTFNLDSVTYVHA